MSSTAEFAVLHACFFDGQSCIRRSAILELDSTGLKSTLFSFLRKEKWFFLIHQNFLVSFLRARKTFRLLTNELFTRKKKLAPDFHHRREKSTWKVWETEDHPPRALLSPSNFIHIIIIRHQLSSWSSIISYRSRSKQPEQWNANNSRHDAATWKGKKNFFWKGKIASNWAIKWNEIKPKNYIFAFGEKSSELEYIMMALPSLSLTLI